MSLINQLAKLAGISNYEDVGHTSNLTEARGDADVSKDELKVIRGALISTVKHLEQEARDTQRSSLTALYKKDADVYDDILGALLKNSRATAKRIWDKQDTGCRDHIFDITKDPEVRQAVAKYFGVTGLKESERGHLQFRVYLKFGDKWERWEAFASEGKAHEEGKNEVKTSSATEYKVKDEGVSESDESDVLARNQGMKAGRAGGSNPHDKGTKEYNEWEDGFDEGKADRRGGYGMQESEQLDELSKTTLKVYAKKALDDMSYHSFDAGDRDASDPERLVSDKKSFKRQKGIEQAINKMAKESADTEFQLNDPFIMGFTSRTSDDQSENNPFEKGSNDHTEWKKGWDEAARVNNESVSVTDYTGTSGNKTGKTRKELLAIAAKTRKPEDVAAARKAGASNEELRQAVNESRTSSVGGEFYVVLDATETSDISDVISKVSTTALKNIILGTPKDKVKDIAIFPVSQKAKAEALAQSRWHDAHVAPEDDEVNEAASQHNHMGERTFQTYAGWKKACKKINSEVWFDGDEDIANAMVGPKPYVRGKTRSIGEWDGSEGSVYTTSTVTESDDVKITQLDDEQETLSNQEDQQNPSNGVPPGVFSDIAKKLKEVKFNIEHLSHIDSSYQEHGYWVRFVVEMEKIVDMLKQGTDEAFKEVAVKLQQFENVALAEVPDSLWKFVSVDMHKPTAKRGQSLSTKFQEIKQEKGTQ